jgi:hypothetical protein
MRPFTHDLWAPLAHRDVVGETVLPPGSASWVATEDARRLAAYRVLSAYRDNVARYYLPAHMWVEPDGGGKSYASKIREYGDPATLVATCRGMVLGADQTIVMPSLDDEDSATLPADQVVFDWLTAWADDEKLRLKLLELEENAVGDGDGIATLGWDPKKNRPRLRIYDPGFYFPDLATMGDDEFPTKVHIAWEESVNDKQLLRVLTWALVDLDVPVTYPWADRPSTLECVYSDVTYDRTRIDPKLDVYTLTARSGGQIKVGADQVRLGVDFIPVVHVPNDAATGTRFFGRSILLLIAHVLDDLLAADTDLALNSELLATPPVKTTGLGADGLNGGPGAEWNLPPGATAELVDTSKALSAQMSMIEHLRDRISTNTRLTAATMGRVAPNDVPSGYALELGFGPTRSLIAELRLVRADKYPMLLRFAARLAQAHNALPAGPLPDAGIALGPFLPADLAAAVERVAKLLPARAISTLTAVTTLIEAGMSVEDAEAEVARIYAENMEAAVQLVDATGDVNAARDRLGLASVVVPQVPDLTGGL